MITVAAGRFAPGHLGELTQQVPFEMVDAVLAQTGSVQSRVRDLPSRVVVYLLLAGCLFAEVGYRQVWQRLVAGLDGLAVAAPCEAGLTKARARIGVKPLRALFDLLRGPAACLAGPVRWRGLLVAAIDGTIISVPDSPANLTVFTKQRGGPCGGGSYPSLRLVALVACGTRSIIDAVFGPTSHGETSYGWRLLEAARAGMLILADRNFAAGKLFAAFAATNAELLVRAKTGAGAPHLPILRRHGDGSYASVFGGTPIRVVEAEITVTTTAGPVTSVYRLLTTLRDPHRYPAGALVRLYHERWEIETAYLELKSSILGGRVLRARTPAGIEQEVYALLVTYQILRTAMCDATNTVPGTDPDRAGPGRVQHRPARRPRPGHPGRRGDRRVGHRPDRQDRPPGAGQPATRTPAAGQRPHRQTRHLQIQRPRPEHRPPHLQATLAITILAGPILTSRPEP